MTATAVRIGISACLRGQEVRYNGGHLSDPFLNDSFSNHVEWVTVCPEVEVGMGVPREPINLVGDAVAPRLLGSRSGIDHTSTMQAWAERRSGELAKADLDGYVFAKDSPSCGLFRVKVHPPNGGPAPREGVGMFARALTERMPDLPAEENGRLHDPRIRENFVERVFVHRRWREMLKTDATPRGLVAFHSAHKLTLMAHSNRHYRELGRLVSEAGTLAWDDLTGRYAPLLSEALRLIATPKKQANVLQHVMGYLKRTLSGEDKQEMLALIDSYRQERVPLIVPLTLLCHHLQRHDVPDWLLQQAYLNPYPEELMLRNHV